MPKPGFQILTLLLLLGGLSLPGLDAKTHPLRVALVQNPRFENLDRDHYLAVLEAAKTLARDFYGLDVDYTQVTEIAIDDLFRPHKERILKEFRIFQYVLPIDPSSKKELQRALTLEYGANSLRELLPFYDAARPRGALGEIQNKAQLFETVAEIHLEKLTILSQAPARDGEPLLTDDLYHQFMLWWFLGQVQSQFDVILTNQLLASVESFHPELHGSLRGGVATGFAGPSPNRYGGAAVVSVFPMISTLPFFEVGRGSRYTRQEITASASGILVHELLHMIRHEKHQWTHEHCIMNPTPGFRYREWAAGFRAHGPCMQWHEPSPFLQRTFEQFRRVGAPRN